MKEKPLKLKVISDASCNLQKKLAVIAYCIMDSDDNVLITGYSDVNPESNLTILEGMALLSGIKVALQEVAGHSSYRISCYTDSQNLVNTLYKGLNGKESKKLRSVIARLQEHLKDDDLHIYHISRYLAKPAHDIAQSRLETLIWQYDEPEQ